jgi:D-sedoheptulose 7-phosphate isomerase
LDINAYLAEVAQISKEIQREPIEKAIDLLRQVRAGHGRLFILGNGGSAANASHAVNDFRKIAKMEASAPTDNVAELTAWTNDEGWDAVYYEWLKESHLSESDALLILSVGGGSKTTSLNLYRAMTYAKTRGSTIISIVSRDGGMALQYSWQCILIPVVNEKHITPYAESWQAIIWHLIVNALAEDL